MGNLFKIGTSIRFGRIKSQGAGLLNKILKEKGERGSYYGDKGNVCVLKTY